MRNPPSLLSLSIDSAVPNLAHFSDLSPLPDHILLDLILRTLRAGKLNEKVLKLFLATGKDEGALKNFDIGGSLRTLVETYKQLVLRSETFVH
ncbi:hypothetical protein ACJRO7_010872 [Eucalyptus globulus]|uniref:Uncharacterized protein n=1 Tax=Eucalyptus globulus TaxID=34317 RepID=A0ABD3LDD4_EUCGL